MSIGRALDNLPPHLAERARPIGRMEGRPRFVLYWVRTAVRTEENPALDVACALARSLGVPVFCYHALSERYPFASDRHHTFILEGARELAGSLADRGLGTAFHLERPGHRGTHLRALAEDAGVVVTEDMPVPPLDAWTRRLAEVAPVVAVDTACVVPMRLTNKPDRAFQHRKTTEHLRETRLTRPWPETPVAGPAFVPDLPFEPLDLSRASIPDLVAATEIDHGVGPVRDTQGGSTAGYARWRAFLESRLERYARDRNDPTRRGTSRMSPYLHYGFVSPFRLAREAAESGGPGAAKLLDELVLWREMAYAFCFHTPRVDTLDALPAWARRTLADHARDARSPRSWELLARGRTGDPLWDLAQRSLVRHGELHNNLRMTWGKALLHWTRSPADALAMLIDLNHRYALDGRDPASYGGLLWCLGLFDRPFEPPGSVRGTTRPRSTADHQRRIGMLAYRTHVERPAHGLGPVAVVGAGIAGLACARTLTDHGVEVTVFDKGRRVGGRAHTRRDAGTQFDHGAQFLTARDPRFVRFVHSWLEEGVLGRWRCVELDLREGDAGMRTRERLVGAPSMRALAEHLATDLDVRTEARVTAVRGMRGSLTLEDEQGGALGTFDAAVVTAPVAQARALLHGRPLLDRLPEGVHVPCWSLMVDFERPVPIEADVVRTDGPVAWAARDGSKPGREDAATWVLHASPSWSAAHLEADPEAVADTLLSAVGQTTGTLPPVRRHRAHRWRFARVTEPVGVPCLYDRDGGIAVAGDGLLGPRIEAAWLSGVAAAGRLLGDQRVGQT